MNITTIELRKLTANDGMILTNGEVYGREIYLGVNDSPDNWHEVTIDEYESAMADAESEDITS